MPELEDAAVAPGGEEFADVLVIAKFTAVFAHLVLPNLHQHRICFDVLVFPAQVGEPFALLVLAKVGAGGRPRHLHLEDGSALGLPNLDLKRHRRPAVELSGGLNHVVFLFGVATGNGAVVADADEQSTP